MSATAVAAGTTASPSCWPVRAAGCELAPLRQIAEVVIDSSSFNKARGDSYQLALMMKSHPSPLATCGGIDID